MRQVIPFKKEIVFTTKISEVTSISLEHSLKIDDDNFIKGDFVVSGDYKITDVSVNKESFSYDLPFTIALDDKYDVSDIKIDIDDFYYELVNDEILRVHIEVLVDGLKEKIVDSIEAEIPEEPEVLIDRNEEVLKEEVKEEVREENPIKSLFDSLDETTESFTTYKVCIVREGETIETIMEKYKVSKEVLEQYNDLGSLSLGDKIIIPSLINE